MRIGLQTWGSDGDILPFLALAAGLADAGHAVTVVCTSVDGKDYTEHGQRGGYRVITVNGPVSSGPNLYALTRWQNPISELNALLRTSYEPLTHEMYAASDELCKRNDAVVGHVLCHTLLTASEKHGCPRIALALSPMVVRTVTQTPLGFSLGKLVNGLMWDIGGWLMTRLLFPASSEFRRKEGLPPVHSLQQELFTSSLLTIVVCSPSVCPPASDWGHHIHVSGFLNVPRDDEWEMPTALRSFLESSGPPPVYMTFGTCMQFDREANLRLLKEAAHHAGQRAIIQVDGMEEGDVGGGIFLVGRTSHRHIFPHCSAIVHHGGAGTTQAALLAGRPSVVVAHAYDQPDWGRRLQDAGVAGKVLRRRSVTAQKLGDAVSNAVQSQEMNRRAAQLGMAMRTEDGVAEAVRLIGQSVG